MHLWVKMAAVVVLISSVAAPAQDGTSGTLRYDNDPSLTITHAVAHEYLIPEELRGNPTGNHRLHILLSDRATTPRAAADEGSFLGSVQTEGLRGIYLEVSLPDRKWDRVSVSRPNAEVEATSHGLDGSEFALSDLSIDGDVVSGRARTMMPQELPDWGDGPTRYAFDIRFRASITRAPVPTERLIGSAARTSPQAAAVISMAELLATNDLARIRAGLHPRLPFAEAMRGSDSEARAALAQASSFIGSPDAVRAAIQHVLVYEDRAVVVTQDSSGGGRFIVERENGAWVVATQDQPYR